MLTAVLILARKTSSSRVPLNQVG